jgi:hypothetical protein
VTVGLVFGEGINVQSPSAFTLMMGVDIHAVMPSVGSTSGGYTVSVLGDNFVESEDLMILTIILSKHPNPKNYI